MAVTLAAFNCIWAEGMEAHFAIFVPLPIQALANSTIMASAVIVVQSLNLSHSLQLNKTGGWLFVLVRTEEGKEEGQHIKVRIEFIKEEVVVEKSIKYFDFVEIESDYLEEVAVNQDMYPIG